jgi:hypothetical protein
LESNFVNKLIVAIVQVKQMNPNGDYRIVCSDEGKMVLEKELIDYSGQEVMIEAINTIKDTPIVVNPYSPNDSILIVDFNAGTNAQLMGSIHGK